MKFNKLAAIMTLTLGMTATGVYAADDVATEGSGQVTFHGHIIDAACSIGADSESQTVELGQISAKQLEDQGVSSPKVFSIALENCRMNTATEEGKPSVITAPMVKVTFGGSPALNADNSVDNNKFGIMGTASGAGVVITDASSAIIPVGGTSEARELIEGKNTLSFSAYLQGLDDNDSIKPGEFTSIADFTLSYE
ncbi:type 1 fimbrial protein [Enterobacter cloacae]|uniref:fimbrial protein n=1 Tax=Enterobacter cloacae TaxID=550 RepID=UPI0020033BBC|nr:fimbrial protein [Enterobacter cloacae]MCK7268867.1 type 1 fimbrial protein [Enterobacter cloacae]